jgi:hypothetical protein
MKKSLLLILLISILCLTLVYAEETPLSNIGNPATLTSENNSSLSFQEKSNAALSRVIVVPSYIEKPLKLLFGINESQTLDLSHIILLTVLLFGFLFFLHILVKILPFFEGAVTSWLATIIILLLISTSGGLKQSADLMFSTMNFFDILSKWSILKLFAAIILTAIVITGLSILTRMMEEKIRPEKARMAGFKTGTGGII